MNVLAIGSHPDDIEFGCAGTIHKLSSKGHHVSLLILTEGGVGGDAAIRRKEQLRSAKSMGVENVYWGNFADTRLPFSDRVITEVERVVQLVKPSFVFVHFGKDTHQDHRHVSECTVVASRNVRNVLFYEGPTSINFTPNVYVDIGDCVKDKLKSLNCHRSQVMRTNIHSESILDISRATAMFRGTQCRVPYAEAFCSLRMFILP
jgi:LmbE family N-acetylglucosaminyl deacetylase